MPQINTQQMTIKAKKRRKEKSKNKRHSRIRERQNEIKIFYVSNNFILCFFMLFCKIEDLKGKIVT